MAALQAMMAGKNNFNSKAKNQNLRLENLIWLDPYVDSDENLLYQKQIANINKFELFCFTKTSECMEKLKKIKFKKTYILISGSVLKEFFTEFEKILNSIKICLIRR